MIFSLPSFPAQVAVVYEVGRVRRSSEYYGCWRRKQQSRESIWSNAQ